MSICLFFMVKNETVSIVVTAQAVKNKFCFIFCLILIKIRVITLLLYSLDSLSFISSNTSFLCICLSVQECSFPFNCIVFSVF